MNKAIKTILIISIAIFGAGFLAVPATFAQNNNNLVIDFDPNPLFSETNFLPGQNATGTARATNDSGQPQRIAAEAINYPGFPNPNNVPAGDLSRALSIIIREKGGSDLYGGSSLTGEKTLFNFYENGETYLNSDISTGGTKTYEFEIGFPPEKENKWQGATTTFDILIGFQGVGGSVPPGTPPSGGGVPGLTIQYERDFYIGTTTAKITWLTSYKSTSRVIHDTQSGVFNLNILPNYGYAFSTPEQDTPAATNGVTYHEVWLTDLQPGITYYFRCVSHGSLAISTEHSFTTLTAKTGQKTEEEIPPEKIGILEIIKKIPERITKEIKKIAETIIPSGPIAESEKPSVPEEIEKSVLVEKKPLGKIFATEGFLAAIGALSLNWKLILIIIGITSIGLFILKLNKKQKTKS